MAKRLQKRHLRRGVGGPWGSSMTRIDSTAIARKHFTNLGDIEVVPPRIEWRQIPFREPEQPHGWSQPLSVLRVGRMLVMFLQMDERPRRLGQRLEILRVLRSDGLRVLKPF